MLSLDNWTWAECQLSNIAERAQQLNLHGEKRKSEEKREKKKKKKRGEGREKRKGMGEREG